jgi:hypothetical protein
VSHGENQQARPRQARGEEDHAPGHDTEGNDADPRDGAEFVPHTRADIADVHTDFRADDSRRLVAHEYAP